MQELIKITFKDGNEVIVPKAAEPGHRKVHPEKIATIQPHGEASANAAQKERQIGEMIAQKQKEIEKRLKKESSGDITENSTKSEIAQALTDKGLKFNPNHRKLDLFNIYVSSTTDKQPI